jgi:hypothetical protein
LILIVNFLLNCKSFYNRREKYFKLPRVILQERDSKRRSSSEPQVSLRTVEERGNRVQGPCKARIATREEEIEEKQSNNELLQDRRI